MWGIWCGRGFRYAKKAKYVLSRLPLSGISRCFILSPTFDARSIELFLPRIQKLSVILHHSKPFERSIPTYAWQLKDYKKRRRSRFNEGKFREWLLREVNKSSVITCLAQRIFRPLFAPKSANHGSQDLSVFRKTFSVFPNFERSFQ